ncbi:MAG: hypothetical protein CLLPBCKN_008331 [Chroococcidiopsis cubana SAG 39.79]|nr:hypothetical protein [Chroococcidiopsis cubana SAG 39.79]
MCKPGEDLVVEGMITEGQGDKGGQGDKEDKGNSLFPRPKGVGIRSEGGQGRKKFTISTPDNASCYNGGDEVRDRATPQRTDLPHWLPYTPHPIPYTPEYASIGWQEQTKLRSPKALSIRPTATQNLCSRVQGAGYAACSRV